MMKIDSNISNKYCYCNLPFDYGIKHLKIAFKPPKDACNKPIISLKGRITHAVLGIIECLPVIGLIVALVEKYFSKHWAKPLPKPIEIIPTTHLVPKRLIHTNPIEGVPTAFSNLPVDKVIDREPQILTHLTQVAPVANNSVLEPQAIPLTQVAPVVNIDPESAIATQIVVSNSQIIAEPSSSTEIANKPSEPQPDVASVQLPDLISQKSVHITDDEFIKAVEEGAYEKVEGFIKDGFQVRNKGFTVSERFGDVSHKVSPLVVAMKNNDCRMFDLLLQSQTIDLYIAKHFPFTDPSDPEKIIDGTALHFACSMGTKGDYFIKALINKRCDPSIESNGKTTDDLAKKSGVSPRVRLELLVYLVSQNHSDSDLTTKILLGDLDGVKCAIKRRASFYETSNLGTPLSIALARFQLTGDLVYKQIFTLLLENGAHPDDYGDHVKPLSVLLIYQFEGWEEMATQLLDKGANPLLYLIYVRGLDENHPIRKRIMQAPQTIEFLLLGNITTVWGIETEVYDELDKAITFNGGNHSEFIFHLIGEISQELIHEPIINNLIDTNILENLPKICKFSNELLLTKNSDAEYAVLLEKIKSSDLPVIIPSGWYGHATSIVIWKNVMLKCNLNLKGKSGFLASYFDQTKFDQNCLKRVLRTFYNPNKLEKKDDDFNFFYGGIYKYLEVKEERHKLLPAQKFQNCSWSSSAFLGLMGAINLLKTVYNEQIDVDKNPEKAIRQFRLDSHYKEVSENFEHFSKYFVMKRYLNALKEHHLKANSIIAKVGEACKVELEKIEAKIAETQEVIKLARLQRARVLYTSLLDEINIIK